MSPEEVALRMERTKLLRDQLNLLERIAEIEFCLERIENPAPLFEIPVWRRN